MTGKKECNTRCDLTLCLTFVWGISFSRNYFNYTDTTSFSFLFQPPWQCKIVWAVPGNFRDEFIHTITDMQPSRSSILLEVMRTPPVVRRSKDFCSSVCSAVSMESRKTSETLIWTMEKIELSATKGKSTRQKHAAAGTSKPNSVGSQGSLKL